VSDETPRPTPGELARLDVHAFRRAMLEGVLADLETARQRGVMTAVMTLTAQVVRLRGEIAEIEERERSSMLSMRSTDELVDDLVAVIGRLPDGVIERVAAAIELRRTGRPRMRVVPQSS
jgi:hypothetical protein